MLNQVLLVGQIEEKNTIDNEFFVWSLKLKKHDDGTKIEPPIIIPILVSKILVSESNFKINVGQTIGITGEIIVRNDKLEVKAKRLSFIEDSQEKNRKVS